MSLLGELKRRNVFRVATFYAVAAWILLQVGELLFSALEVPPWGLKLLLGLLLLGFPLALVFAWVYELTPEGLKREHEVERGTSITARTATKLNVLVAILLVVAVAWFVADRFVGAPGPDRSAAASLSTATPPSSPAASPAPVGTADELSIAVLPFVNISDDRGNDYFSDGLSEELLNMLTHVPELRVIARTSSFSYKGKAATIADIARDLHVSHVLEGSVRKAGSRVRITTQLIRTSDSSHLWSETYDRDLTDIFVIQDEIATEVVDALKIRLLRPGSTVSLQGGTNSPEAYEAYLRGRHLSRQGESELTLRQALAASEEAVRLDPDYARAHADRAYFLSRLASNAHIPFAAGFAQSRQSARRALELAPELADALATLAWIEMYVDMNPRVADATLERATRLEPHNPAVVARDALFRTSRGQHQRAIAGAQEVVQMDPVAPGAHVSMAQILLMARQYDGAERAARHALSLDGDFPRAHFWAGLSLLLQGRHAEALAEFDRESTGWMRLTGRALVLSRMGEMERARAEFAALIERHGDASSYQGAQISASLGDRDEAFRWLRNAQRHKDPGLMSFVFVDPLLDPLRTDPRWQALVRELGLVDN